MPIAKAKAVAGGGGGDSARGAVVAEAADVRALQAQFTHDPPEALPVPVVGVSPARLRLRLAKRQQNGSRYDDDVEKLTAVFELAVAQVDSIVRTHAGAAATSYAVASAVCSSSASAHGSPSASASSSSSSSSTSSSSSSSSSPSPSASRSLSPFPSRSLSPSPPPPVAHAPLALKGVVRRRPHLRSRSRSRSRSPSSAASRAAASQAALGGCPPLHLRTCRHPLLRCPCPPRQGPPPLCPLRPLRGHPPLRGVLHPLLARSSRFQQLQFSPTRRLDQHAASNAVCVGEFGLFPTKYVNVPSVV